MHAHTQSNTHTHTDTDTRTHTHTQTHAQTSTRHPPDPLETPPDTAQTPHRPPPDTHQTHPRHLPDAGSPFHVWACRSYCQGSRIPMYMSTLYAGHLRLCLQATLTF